MTQAPSPAPQAPGSSSGRRALGWFLLILVALYLPLFLGRILFVRDIAHWVFPARAFVRASLLAGELALLEAGAPALPGPSGRAGTRALTRYSARRVEARCRAEREALAVFVEQYDPGWRATIDGQSAPILRANLVMRALRLAPGEHHITLDYAAPGLSLGLSLFGLATLLGFAIAGRRTGGSARGAQA